MYSFSVTLKDNFDSVIKRVTEVLQQEKFGILNDINVDTVLRNKLNVEIPHYRILHACNPALAHRLVSKEPDVGALLPCNVVVREGHDGTTTVVFMDPVATFKLTNNPEVIAIAEEARTMLMRVKEKLAG